MCSQFIVTLVADVAADLQGTLADLKAARIAAAARARRIRLHQTAEWDDDSGDSKAAGAAENSSERNASAPADDASSKSTGSASENNAEAAQTAAASFPLDLPSSVVRRAVQLFVDLQSRANADEQLSLRALGFQQPTEAIVFIALHMTATAQRQLVEKSEHV